MASRRGGLMVRASPRTSRWMVSSRTPRARAMRAEPWPITCRARSRSRVPPASRRAKVSWWTVAASRRVLLVISVHRLGLVVTGLACLAGGVEGAGDLRLVQAGLAGGGQGAQVGGGVGVEGTVGGPVQA